MMTECSHLELPSPANRHSTCKKLRKVWTHTSPAVIQSSLISIGMQQLLHDNYMSAEHLRVLVARTRLLPNTPISLEGHSFTKKTRQKRPSDLQKGQLKLNAFGNKLTWRHSRPASFSLRPTKGSSFIRNDMLRKVLLPELHLACYIPRNYISPALLDILAFQETGNPPCGLYSSGRLLPALVLTDFLE
eukprot:1160549-Pelagomonas_calceolata.AAC.2